jgi:hypothetical protein
MREHLHSAARRRDERLARIRRLSLWITGGAAAASLGLGTAFAHALPGHAAATSSGASAAGAARAAAGAAGAGARAGRSGKPAAGGSAPSAPATSASAGASAAHHAKHGLARPKQQPASTPAPPVVSSGGS